MIAMEVEMTDVNPEFKVLLTKFEEEKDPEAKLNLLIDFMEASLAQAGSPRFKNFWEARKLSLELFKEVVNPQVRTQLWSRYSELSKEARRLKDLLDQESAFNVEQIEMAITALEEECQNTETLKDTQSTFQLPSPSSTLESEIEYYEPRQRELNLLNTFASRINGLRKELIRTEMRIRQKNKFFQRLSQAGDLVFPRRKLLIEEVSQKFREDVNHFVETFFANGIRESHFFLRDEIKGLQGAAKELTLSAQVFKDTRLHLSECWDKLKVEEKELKKHRQEQKEVFKVNYNELNEILKGISARFEAKELTTHAAEKELDGFSQEMRQRELGRDEVRALRGEMDVVRDLLYAEARKEEEERQREAVQREQERRERVLNFKNRILAMITDAEKLEVEAILAERDAIIEEINSSNLPRHEKLELDKAFRPLKEVLSEKNEQRLLSLPENDRQALEQLRELLKDRKARRQEQRELTDELRRNSGMSGLDFVKALEMSTLLNEEKEKLDKMSSGIKELEEKIAAFEKK